MNDKPIKSPYADDLSPQIITKEHLRQIEKIIGFKKIFIIASNANAKDDMKSIVCTGIGFHPKVLKEVLNIVAEDVIKRMPEDEDD